MDFPTWAALVEGPTGDRRAAVGPLDRLRLRRCLRQYLHAHGGRPPERWADTGRKLDAWLWIGTAEDPAAAIQAAAAGCRPPR
jgi:hypothetical protein